MQTFEPRTHSSVVTSTTGTVEKDIYTVCTHRQWRRNQYIKSLLTVCGLHDLVNVQLTLMCRFVLPDGFISVLLTGRYCSIKKDKKVLSSINGVD